VWMLAERIGLSAILTMVVFAMTLARRLAGRISARHQLATYTVWEVAVLVLNVLAFVLVGLQLRGIIERVHGGEWQTYALCGGAVVLAVIVVRIGWIMLHTSFDRWRLNHSGHQPPPETVPTFRAAMLSSWCGMRGIVTLAAALALPESPPAFPHRDLIVFCAFAVVLTTLVVQGMTLGPLMKWLGLRDDGTVEREVNIARAETARAALRVFEDQGSRSLSVDILAAEYQARLTVAESDDTFEADGAERAKLTAIHQLAVSAQRTALTRLRAEHRIGDDAFMLLTESRTSRVDRGHPGAPVTHARVDDSPLTLTGSPRSSRARS
jgi:hypothetical protein